MYVNNIYTVKPVLNSHSQKDQKIGFQYDYHLMQVKSIAECSKGSILEYFKPSLSYHLSFRPMFCLFFEWSFYTGLTVCTSTNTTKQRLTFHKNCLSMHIHFLKHGYGTHAFLFDLIFYIPSTIFQLNRDRSSWIEPVLS